MLMLIWSKEAPIKNAVIEGFKRLYIEGKDSKSPSTVAHNFIGYSLLPWRMFMTKIDSLRKQILES